MQRNLALIAILLASPALARAEAKVIPKTGSVVIVTRDLGFAPGLRVTRAYNSKTSYVGMLGVGWSLELETTLVINADKTISVRDAGGGALTKYLPDGPNVFRAQGSPFDAIVKSPGGYARKLKDGTVEKFDPKGRLVRLEEGGSFIDLRYATSGRISEAVDNLGHRLRFAYDNAGHVTWIQHAGSAGTRYGYDTSGRLISVRAPDDKETRFAYDTVQRHLLVEVLYPDDTSDKFTYYGRDKLSSVRTHIDTQVYKSTYEYEISGSRIDGFTLTVARPDGVVGLVEKSRFAFNQGRMTKSILESGRQKIETTYDASERPVQIAFGDKKLSLEYDSLGRLTRYQAGDEETRFTYGPRRSPAAVTSSGKKSFRLEYDSQERPRALTLPSGKKFVITYDGKGRPRAASKGAAELVAGLREVAQLTRPLEMKFGELAENLAVSSSRSSGRE